MKELINLIKRYWKLKIQCKTSERKQLQRLDEVTKQLYEIVADMNILMEEFKKESYKTKFQEEHKKYKELYKKYKEEVK